MSEEQGTEVPRGPWRAAHQDHIWTQLEKFVLGKLPPRHGTQTKCEKVLLAIPWAQKMDLSCFC